jgi:hypothetical protein
MGYAPPPGDPAPVPAGLAEGGGHGEGVGQGGVGVAEVDRPAAQAAFELLGRGSRPRRGAGAAGQVVEGQAGGQLELEHGPGV